MKNFKGKITVAKAIKLPKASLPKIRRRKGASNVGKYPDVRPSDFAGGKENPYSFPINTRKRAKSALSYARYGINPNQIRERACNKYPTLCSKKTLKKIKKSKS